jgi:chemotaxis protein methyltransferase WspC
VIYAEVESLLAQRIGLDARSLGAQAVRRAIETRMAASDTTDPHAYLDQLRGSANELQALIEAIVVSETWFFRDREAFAALVSLLRQKRPIGADAPLRILSLPCATGEEPYTIAMAMLDASFAPSQFCIDGIDISRPALALARAGLYGKNSFRGCDLDFRARHFTPEAPGYRIAQAVRDRVQFCEGNILEAGFTPGAKPYDAIFCRNMLIYFSAEAQDQAVRILVRCLAEDGTLFVGPSETALLLAHGLVSEDIPFSFGYRRKKPAAGAEMSRHLPAPRFKPSAAARKPFQSKPKSAKPAAPARGTNSLDQTLENIRLMADQGQLAEAAQQCERYLSLSGPASETFYLLALIRDAAGATAEAAGWYRKALYLDPAHREAMAHLSLLLEQQGDTAGARLLKERLSRLDQEGVRS